MWPVALFLKDFRPLERQVTACKVSGKEVVEVDAGERRQVAHLAASRHPRTEQARVQQTRPDSSTPRHAVFISDFLHLARPFAEMSAEMLDPSGPFLAVAERSAATQGFTLVIGEPRHYDSTVVVPIHFEPSVFEPPMPFLDADIELSSLGGGRCRLSLSGRYRSPPPRPDDSTDRLTIYRAAESAVRLLLADIAQAMETL